MDEAPAASLTTTPSAEAAFAETRRKLDELVTLLNGIIVGQHELVVDLATAIFAGGHVLIEGLPGLGKTHLAKALAAALGLRYARVQCTPDLMPADITGAEVYASRPGGPSQFEFRAGPIFANLLLVDEINRATPRTQAALLEAMQERQVTHAGTTHALPQPFCVLATQNPIELEGTYPLPEAQLDRFTFKLDVPFPSSSALRQMLEVSLDDEPADALQPIATANDVLWLAETCRSVLVGERCKQAAVALIEAAQPDSGSDERTPARHIRYGASPRALQALVRAARVRAVMQGRAHLDIADLDAVARPVLRHRILLRLESELEGIDADSVISGVIERWRQRL